MRVSIRVQQARLRGQQGAAPVYVYRSALHYEAWSETGEPQHLGHASRNLVIEIMGWVLSAP